MKHLTTYALILSLVLMTHYTKAQEANKSDFTLQQAIEYAEKNSPSHLNTDLDQQSALHKKKEVTGMGLPQIKGSFDVKNYIEIPTSLIPAAAFDPSAPADAYAAVKFGTKYNSTAGLSASQLIFSSDYIFALKASKEFMNLSRISVTRSKSELTAQVSKAYYTVLINKDRIKLLDANLVRLKKIFDETKAFNQQGFAELIDVERLEVQYNNLVTEKDKTEKFVGISESLLKFQMGYNLSDPITLSDSLNVSTESFQELSTAKPDLSKRPDYQLLNAQQTLLDIDVKRLKWGYLPTLVAYGSYSFNRQGNQLDLFAKDDLNPTKKWYKIALVGVTLDLTIFDGLQRHHKIQQAKITALQNKNNLRNLELAGELEATTAAISYNNAYKTLLSQKRNMELAQHVVDVAQKKYTGGVGSNIEVVTAETSLQESQVNYYSAVYDMLVARVDYQRALGTLVK
jgi:outer membrane protein